MEPLAGLLLLLPSPESLESPPPEARLFQFQVELLELESVLKHCLDIFRLITKGARLEESADLDKQSIFQKAKLILLVYLDYQWIAFWIIDVI